MAVIITTEHKQASHDAMYESLPPREVKIQRHIDASTARVAFFPTRRVASLLIGIKSKRLNAIVANLLSIKVLTSIVAIMTLMSDQGVQD